MTGVTGTREKGNNYKRSIPLGPRTSHLSMRPLKNFAKKNLPETSPLREIILAEKDYLTPEEFRAKVPIWRCLVKREA